MECMRFILSLLSDDTKKHNTIRAIHEEKKRGFRSDQLSYISLNNY